MTAPVAGTQAPSGDAQQVTPGALFGVPKYGTMSRFVPDNGNETLAAVPNSGSQINVPVTRLDQLDIVRGLKIPYTQDVTYTAGAGKTITASPFGSAAAFQQITFKLQAAYNSFNLTGPLAAIHQTFRPMFNTKNPSGVNNNDNNSFCSFSPVAVGELAHEVGVIDIPLSIKFDEYFDLSAQGDPVRKVYDAIVSPYYMAAMARVVQPTITLSPTLKVGDTLGAQAAIVNTDDTSTATLQSFIGGIWRDAWWTASNPVANPPQYPWMYTNDYFTQPTNGQGTVGVLIQNTGVSVGQVLSLYGFVWDPAANAGLGGIVPLTSAVESIELVTGGSLQNLLYTPQLLHNRMSDMYGDNATNLVEGSELDGVFIIDFALEEEGSYLSNANAINTYLVNGVQLNIKFLSGHVPSATSTVYLGVEALKLATS